MKFRPIRSMKMTWVSLILTFFIPNWFPWLLSGRESSCNARDARDSGLIPGSGKSPGGGNDNPLKYSCLDNPIDREAWWAIVLGVTKSQKRL